MGRSIKKKHSFISITRLSADDRKTFPQARIFTPWEGADMLEDLDQLST